MTNPLSAFFRDLMTEYWDHGAGDIDGGWLQETLLRHGLIRAEPYDPDNHFGGNFDGREPGETIFVLSDDGKAAADDPSSFPGDA